MNIFWTPGKGVLMNLYEFLHSDKNLETEKSCRSGFSRKIICPKIGKNGPARSKIKFP